VNSGFTLSKRGSAIAVKDAARKWSQWKAQERYRARRAGQVKRNAQSRRYRERMRSRKAKAGEAARVITATFFRGWL
jgi:hypothetical protein